jgi:hypothetical protein
MQKFHQLRRMLARHVLALDYNNIMLGAVVQDFIENTYIPKLKAKISRLRDEDTREREKLERVLALWQRELKNKEWNVKAAKKVKDVAAKFRITGDDFIQDAASDLVLNIYSGSDNKTLQDLRNFDPEDGPSKLMSFWLTAVWSRAHNHFKALVRKDKTILERAEGSKSDDGDVLDPLDKIKGDAPVSEREIDALIRQMRTHVMSYSYKGNKIGDDPILSELANAWFLAFDRKNDMSAVDIKRDVAPKVTKKFDIKYNTIMKRKWPAVLDALADFFSKEFSGSKSYFKRMLKASEEEVSMQERLAEDFFIREMKAWMIGPAYRIQEVLKRAYAKV